MLTLFECFIVVAARSCFACDYMLLSVERKKLRRRLVCLWWVVYC